MDFSEDNAVLSSKKLIVASSKGGIGKSTISSGIASALAETGRRVLLADMDCGNGSLDLMLGVQDDVIYNWGDVALDRITPSAALICPPGKSGLFFAAAPSDVCPVSSGITGEIVSGGRTAVNRDDIIRALNALQHSCEAEYVICDTAAGIDVPLMLAGTFSDRAIIASSHQPSSMRAAENTARMLEDAGVNWIRMIVSAFELSGAYNEKRAGLIDIIDNAHVQIIGVVPYDRQLMLDHEHGDGLSGGSAAHRAFANIAERLEGNSVKLFKGIKGIAKRKIY